MSFKSKNLQYEANEPAFLRRLRAQNAGQGEDGRHERQIARPKRVKQDDEEDAPAYVVEDSNETLSKEDYEAMLKEQGKTVEAQAGGPAEVDRSEEETLGIKGELTSDEPKASGALPDDRKDAFIREATVGSKKRKAAKVVGDDMEEPSTAQSPKDDRSSKKPKKKGKPIKLSFGDEQQD